MYIAKFAMHGHCITCPKPSLDMIDHQILIMKTLLLAKMT